MNAGNAASLLEMENIDGGLIGGASLKPAEFAAIVQAANTQRSTVGYETQACGAVDFRWVWPCAARVWQCGVGRADLLS